METWPAGRVKHPGTHLRFCYVRLIYFSLSLFLSHCSKDLEWWTTYSSNRQSFIQQAAGSILNNRLVSALLHLSYNLNRRKAVGSRQCTLEAWVWVDPWRSAPSSQASLFVLFISSPQSLIDSVLCKIGLVPTTKMGIHSRPVEEMDVFSCQSSHSGSCPPLSWAFVCLFALHMVLLSRLLFLF